jgi:hypothetical protein
VFDSLDFSKPEKYLKEIYYFIEKNANLDEENDASNKMKLSNLTFFKKSNNFQTLSGSDAQILIFELLKIVFDP